MGEVTTNYNIMKKFIFALVAFALLVPAIGVQARSSNQSDHFKNNAPYDCSVTKKPAAPKWVDARAKKEKVGNHRIELIWEDADRAHDVEILWKKLGDSKWKSKKTGDDGDQTFKDLKGGQYYSFKVRGYSNCGKSSYTDAKNTTIIGKPNKFLP